MHHIALAGCLVAPSCPGLPLTSHCADQVVGLLWCHSYRLCSYHTVDFNTVYNAFLPVTLYCRALVPLVCGSGSPKTLQHLPFAFQLHHTTVISHRGRGVKCFSRTRQQCIYNNILYICRRLLRFNCHYLYLRYCLK